LLIIVGFVAGDNKYGTLLNFALASKVIREEMNPVLYETIEPSGLYEVEGPRKIYQIGEGYRYTR
jgi:hypothetical protein